MKIDKTIPQIHHWIDDTVVIDFELTQRLKDLIEEIEQLDENEHWGYFNYVETLDNVCKSRVGDGKMTREQWDTLLYKYCQ